MNSSGLFPDGGSYNYAPLNSERAVQARGMSKVTLLSLLVYLGVDSGKRRTLLTDGLFSLFGSEGWADMHVSVPSFQPLRAADSARAGPGCVFSDV